MSTTNDHEHRHLMVMIEGMQSAGHDQREIEEAVMRATGESLPARPIPFVGRIVESFGSLLTSRRAA